MRIVVKWANIQAFDAIVVVIAVLFDMPDARMTSKRKGGSDATTGGDVVVTGPCFRSSR